MDAVDDMKHRLETRLPALQVERCVVAGQEGASLILKATAQRAVGEFDAARSTSW